MINSPELTDILSEGHWIAVCWNPMDEAIAWRKLGTDTVIYFSTLALKR